MATVTSYTKDKIAEIMDDTIVDGSINGSGHLILERQDASTIDAGSVIGPTGAMGSMDPGDIVTSIRTAKTGYLLLNGSVVADADVAYPALWAVVPASWKSGSNLVLPNMTNRLLQGAGAVALGTTGGANTKVIGSANLPPHTHTGPSHTHTTPNHNHTMNHIHGMGHTHVHQHTHFDTFAATTEVTVAIRESSTPGTFNSLMAASNSGVDEVRVDVNPVAVTAISGSVGSTSSPETDPAVPDTTGSSSIANTGTGGGSTTGASGTAATGNGPGTSSPLDVQQASLSVNYFVKT